MAIQRLNAVVSLLKQAQISAGEAFSDRNGAPGATVRIKAMDQATGMEEYTVCILNPRKQGAWRCENLAVQAMQALQTGGLCCRMGQTTYEQGCDCFCVEITARGIRNQGIGKVRVNGLALGNVTEFSAEQDRQRRLVGAIGQGEPVAISPGSGGWKIRVVQRLPAWCMLPEAPAEPFVLTAQDGQRNLKFSGCGWNRMYSRRTAEETVVEWEGFGLTREVLADESTEV